MSPSAWSNIRFSLGGLDFSALIRSECVALTFFMARYGGGTMLMPSQSTAVSCSTPMAEETVRITTPDGRQTFLDWVIMLFVFGASRPAVL